MNHTTISSIAKLLTISLASSAFIIQPAMATMPETHIFNNATEASDEALAGMRGRYAGPGGMV